ncbi:MbnP family protein [Marivirga sp.]|uniref:MbnP family protein n=1 Tax=Marivirga sp. TaxID=2018662 RepID=UPI002D80D71D|nr:MbnP family protein [Marivirga sp.]HET8860043.1 MbnP family protein [Marivirga sp.]
MKITNYSFFALALLFFACQDDMPKTTNLQLEFAHKAGIEDFEYGRMYENIAGNRFSLRLWRTYISDVKLLKSDGEIYSVPNSYHLIEPQNLNRFTLNLSDIPTGTYESIQYYIGVTDEENLSGQLVGDLDPSNNMAWNWTTGYKFIRMDGEFEDNEGNRRGVVVHIGTNENLKLQSFTFQNPLILGQSEGHILFELDLLEAFKSPHTIDFEVLNDFQFNNEADLIGENYANGFIKLIK